MSSDNKESAGSSVVASALFSAVVHNSSISTAVARRIISDIGIKCGAIFNCVHQLQIVGGTNMATLSRSLQMAFSYLSQSPDSSWMTEELAKIFAGIKGKTFCGSLCIIPVNKSLDIADSIDGYLWLEAIKAIHAAITDFWQLKQRYMAPDASQEFWCMVKVLRFLLAVHRNFGSWLHNCGNPDICSASLGQSQISERVTGFLGSQIAQTVYSCLMHSEACDSKEFRAGAEVVAATDKAMNDRKLAVDRQVEVEIEPGITVWRFVSELEREREILSQDDGIFGGLDARKIQELMQQQLKEGATDRAVSSSAPVISPCSEPSSERNILNVLDSGRLSARSDNEPMASPRVLSATEFAERSPTSVKSMVSLSSGDTNLVGGSASASLVSASGIAVASSNVPSSDITVAAVAKKM